jgi:hypothetical protein
MVRIKSRKMNTEELQKRVDELAKADGLGFWYQRIRFGDIDSPTRTNGHPASFDEGKWGNYIAPLLKDVDKGNGIFCEMGTNAGLFLLLAHNHGYSRLWGVEAANAAFGQLQLTAEYYNNLGIRPIFASLGKPQKDIANTKALPFDIRKFPIVDTTLMSLFTYYIEPTTLQNYVDALSEKSMHVVVVTSEVHSKSSPGQSGYIKKIFRPGNWELVQEIRTTIRDGRRNLTSMLFKSRILKRILVKDRFEAMLPQHGHELFYGVIFEKFAASALRGESANTMQVYEWLRSGKNRTTAFSHRICWEAVCRWWCMVRDIAKNGQKEPVILKPKGTDRMDGYHRLAILQYLGVKWIYGVDRDVRAKCND